MLVFVLLCFFMILLIILLCFLIAFFFCHPYLCPPHTLSFPPSNEFSPTSACGIILPPCNRFFGYPHYFLPFFLSICFLILASFIIFAFWSSFRSPPFSHPLSHFPSFGTCLPLPLPFYSSLLLLSSFYSLLPFPSFFNNFDLQVYHAFFFILAVSNFAHLIKLFNNFRCFYCINFF